MSKKQCRACGAEYIPRKGESKRICRACAHLLSFKVSRSIGFIEKARLDYNKTHKKIPSYGQFVNLIENIERKRRGI